LAGSRPGIDQAHVVLAYLLVVLGGSLAGGRPLGFTLAALAFAAIDYWFQLPYDTLTVAKPLDWLVLVAFLATAMVTTQLLARAHAREDEARRHSAEVVRLAHAAQHAEALREADRLKDALLAAVSHDLRTPLTTIKALAHDCALRGDPRGSAIETEVDRLTHLVTNLLDYSRLTGGRIEFRPELNTAEDLVGAVRRQVAGVLDGRRLETEFDWSQPALVGRFDFVHALRALGNLVENAIKYSPPAATIIVTVERTRSVLAFHVADRGPGVQAAERSRIFDAFYRPSEQTPHIGGAGLGLAIARQLAKAQGGCVDYTPREGGGSVFTLELPAADVSRDLPEASL
jgi:K+-sensing histidine kinase KdpD